MALNQHDGGTPAGMERDPRLDRLYRGAVREEPPAHIDAAIRAAARREVGARPRTAGSYLRAWRMPVSIAAVIVLSVSLVTLIREEGREELMEAPPPPPALARPEAAAPPAKLEDAAPVPQAPAAKPGPRDDFRPVRPDAAREADENRRRVLAPSEKPKAEPAPRPQTGSEVPQPFPGAPGESAPQRGAPAAEGKAPAMLGERAAPGAKTIGAASLPAAPAKPSDPTSEVGALHSDRSPAAEAPKHPPGEVRGSGRTLAPSQEAAVASKEARRPAWFEFEREPPRKWLERIEELRRQGHLADANDMLLEFKRRFPEHPLPASLR